MAQPTTQLGLAAGHTGEYFYYPNGTGLWDAKNGAFLTKTGSGSVSATGSAGELVANGNGSTYYDMGAALVLTGPFTISFKAKRTSPTGNAGMVVGNRDSIAANYFWILGTDVRPFIGTAVTTSGSDSWHTYTFVKNADGTGKLYKDGALLSATAWVPSHTIRYLLSGYTGDAYALDGALEYFHIIPGVALDASGVSALVADPYQALAAAGGDGSATGTLASITISPATATATGTGGANGDASGTPAAVSLTAPTATAAGSAAGSGTITTPALKNNTGTVLASISGWTVNVYNVTTGAFVVQKTGLMTSAVGVLTITDAAIASGTTYAYEPFHATYGRRLPTSVAA